MAMSERKEGWFRIIVTIISGIILEIWQIAIIVLGILNWLITIITGKRNRSMAEFSEYWNTEMYKYARYLTFVSNIRPFPFTSASRITKYK